jgi:hypothetical protein
MNTDEHRSGKGFGFAPSGKLPLSVFIGVHLWFQTGGTATRIGTTTREL